jgi:hypothetical protein
MPAAVRSANCAAPSSEAGTDETNPPGAPTMAAVSCTIMWRSVSLFQAMPPGVFRFRPMMSWRSFAGWRFRLASKKRRLCG